MRTILQSKQGFYTLIGFLKLSVAALLLSACSGSTTKNQYPVSSLTPTEIQQEIIKAEKSSNSKRNSQFIALATQLYTLDENQQAINLIERVSPSELNDKQYIDYVLIASELYVESQYIFKANHLLSAKRLTQSWKRLDSHQQKTLHRHKARIYSQLGDSHKSAIEYIALDKLLNNSLEIIENHDLLWQELTKLSRDSLTSLEAETTDPTTQGWYQLAQINERYKGSIATKDQQIKSWVASNPNHPASLELPLDLQLLDTLIEEQPTKIALLLPIEGKLAAAGKTIRDGFFAAYHDTQDIDKPEVVVYDTSLEPINSIYDRATAEGADLVIGPLEKSKVAELQQREQLAVTTLALNYNIPGDSDQEGNTPAAVHSSLYQFGLSLEDEAVQAADRAWLEGHRYAMVLASDASWSQRAANAFSQHWHKYGGKVAVSHIYDTNNSYAETIRQALSIDESQARARKLKRLIRRNFEFEPRRRQDIDMIFLVARTNEGRQIKPTLSFYYAGNIPVYATSQIYAKSQTADKNRDLNGIRFTTLPWILDPEKQEKSLKEGKIKIHASYERLYAMGIDSFLIHNRLRQLARSPATAISGSTGKLSMDSNQRIVRQQPWAEMVKGEIQALPLLTQEDEDI